MTEMLQPVDLPPAEPSTAWPRRAQAFFAGMTLLAVLATALAFVRGGDDDGGTETAVAAAPAPIDNSLVERLETDLQSETDARRAAEGDAADLRRQLDEARAERDQLAESAVEQVSLDQIQRADVDLRVDLTIEECSLFGSCENLDGLPFLLQITCPTGSAACSAASTGDDYWTGDIEAAETLDDGTLVFEGPVRAGRYVCGDEGSTGDDVTFRLETRTVSANAVEGGWQADAIEGRLSVLGQDGCFSEMELIWGYGGT